jgi:hypothetical protein
MATLVFPVLWFHFPGPFSTIVKEVVQAGIPRLSVISSSQVTNSAQYGTFVNLYVMDMLQKCLVGIIVGDANWLYVSPVYLCILSYIGISCFHPSDLIGMCTPREIPKLLPTPGVQTSPIACTNDESFSNVTIHFGMLLDLPRASSYHSIHVLNEF